MADLKISALTADAAPQATDYVTTIRSPFGAGSNRKVLLSTLGIGGGDFFLADDKYLKMGNVLATPDAALGWNTAQTVDALFVGLSAAQNTFIIAEYADAAYDFAHGAQEHPTLFLQSKNQSATEFSSWNASKITFGLGVATVGTEYAFGRNADSTNLAFWNVPTGASFVRSVNDVAIETLSATRLTLPSAGITIGAGVGVISTTDAALDIFGDTNAVIHAHNTGAQSTSGGVAIIGYAVPVGAAMLSGNRLGTFVMGGSITVANALYNSTAISSFATENWSATAGGSKIAFEVTPNTTVARATALIIDQNSQLLGVLGSATAPTYSFASDPDTGIYATSGTLRFTAGGATRWNMGDTGILSSSAGILLQSATNSADSYLNHVLGGTNATTHIIGFQQNSTWGFTQTFTGDGAAAAGPNSYIFAINGSGLATAGQTAATERKFVSVPTSTITWPAGAGPLALQRHIHFAAPTYNGNAGGAITMTEASTLYVDAPIAGTDITITNSFSAVFTGNIKSEKKIVFTGAEALAAPGAGKSTIFNNSGLYISTGAAGTTDRIYFIGGATALGNIYTGGFTLSAGQFLAPAGTVAAPSHSFSGALGAGMYEDGRLRFAHLGVNHLILAVDGMTLSGTDGFTITNRNSNAVTTLITTNPFAVSASTAGAERNDFLFNSANRTWATGAVATQRFLRAEGSTILAVGASAFTDVMNFWIDTPNISTNATVAMLNAVQAGGNFTINQTAGTTYGAIGVPAHTATIGSLGTQITSEGFSAARLGIITLTSGTATTIDKSSTLLILGAPLGAGSITLSETNALKVVAGNSRFGGQIISSLSGATAQTAYSVLYANTAYSSEVGLINIARSGALTGVDTESIIDFNIEPAFTLTEPGSGSVNFFAQNIDISNVVVTAGAGTSVLAALRLVANADADAGTQLALWVDAGLSRFDGHINSTQTTAPTTTLTNTTLNDGAGSGAAIAVTAGSTDTAGSFTVTAGNGTPTAGIAGQVVFNVAYVSAPKSVIVTSKDADGVDNQIYITNVGTTSFEISFGTTLAASEAVEFYYWVIE
jgi:hypothetical protein